MRFDLVSVSVLAMFLALGCAHEVRGDLGLDARCRGESPRYLSFCEPSVTPWGRRL